MKGLLIVLLFGVSGVAFAASEVGSWSVRLSVGEAHIEGVVRSGEPFYGRHDNNIEYQASSTNGRGQKAVAFIGYGWKIDDIKEDADGLSAVVSVTATRLEGMKHVVVSERDAIYLPSISTTTVEQSIALQEGVEVAVASGVLPVRLVITRTPQ
ncbi:MAG: hypothetical protein CVV05_00265 [Gammaproteobacteria bacterium HGW-Gammaproteobacteria-1]|jgi:hypothetical protein|nr:MAG: hypothetical protein CVV05_00265 [Gammaproteobacteria bacterium HGW-Gammaproteobacteria-1]